MAKKKSTKKTKKKSTKKVKGKPSSFIINHSILNRIIKYFKFGKIEDFLVQTYSKENKILFSGIGDSTVAFCSYQIYGIDVGDLVMLFKLTKLEKILKTMKDEITISKTRESNAILTSGRIRHKMALEPTNTPEMEEFMKNSNILSNKYPEYDAYYKCTIDPNDFADVISIGSNMDFTETMYFGPYTEDSIKVSLLESTQVDESEVTLPTYDVEIEGKPEIVLMHPKFAKIFEIFDNSFELILPYNFPIRAQLKGFLGESDEKLKFKIVIAIATKEEITEEDAMEEDEEMEDIDVSDEPTEEYEFEEEEEEEY